MNDENINFNYTIIKSVESVDIIKRSDGVWIPMDNNNVDYRDFLEWKSKGNEPKEEIIK